MYETKQIYIKKGNKMFPYFEGLCKNCNNLYNTTNFTIRQYATAKYAFEEYRPLYELQIEVFQQVESVTKDKELAAKIRKKPLKETEATNYKKKTDEELPYSVADNVKWLNYNAIDFYFKMTNNPDYYSVPSQLNQQIIKSVLRDYKSYFEGIKKYKSNPSDMTGRPNMPGYKKKGGKSSVILTNQVCKIKEDKYLKFPLTKEKVNIQKLKYNGALQEVRITPTYEGFVLDIVFKVEYENEIILEDGHNEKLLAKCKEITNLTDRALAIDPGLSNLCTVTNNFGATPYVIKGGTLKSINQYYNKNIAKYESAAKKCNNVHYTLHMHRLTKNRNNRVKDYIHKTTAYIVKYAIDNNVKYIVIGHNNGQKQEIKLGNTKLKQQQNNQNFVTIPFNMLIQQLQYKLNRVGIELIVTEESYTSQASFENMDYLPTYGVDDDKANFTGARKKRGLYQTNGKKPINADVNGAANTMRKVFSNVGTWSKDMVKTPETVKLRFKEKESIDTKIKKLQANAVLRKSTKQKRFSKLQTA